MKKSLLFTVLKNKVLHEKKFTIYSIKEQSLKSMKKVCT